MTTPKKSFTRHKLLTLYYEDEGDGNGAMYLETASGTVCIGGISINANMGSRHAFEWFQMLDAGAAALQVRSTFDVTLQPCEPILVLAADVLKGTSTELP